MNQYTQRDVPGYVAVLGTASTGAVVVVNLETVNRQGAYFHKALALTNTVSAVYTNLQIVGFVAGTATNRDTVSVQEGPAFLPQSPETFAYDADGNLVRDGRWEYAWDAENRLITMETGTNALAAGTPRVRMQYEYDYMGRRVKKVAYSAFDGASFGQTNVTACLYDGWNLIKECAVTPEHPSAVTNLYVWGLDLSGTIQGAGGIGGLLAGAFGDVISGTNVITTAFYLYDANGNVGQLVDATGTNILAAYEYSPYGEPVRAEGPLAQNNPFRFSSKYTDNETGLVYYGLRTYSPQLGRWLSRDPIGERGGMNLHVFTGNAPVNSFDILGLWAPPWCKDECPGDGFRNSFRITDFVMGAIAPTEQAGLDAALLYGELVGMMPTGLSPREMAEWLVEQGFPSGDLLSTYVRLILSGLPWNLYVVFEVDICKESTCCIFWEDRRYVKHSGVHRCTKGGNLGNGLWFPRSKVDQVPTRILQECRDEAMIEVLGGGGSVWRQ